MRLRQMALSLALLLGLGASAQPADAAEQIVLTYGVLRRSISVAELSQFAATGETSRSLRTYLRLSGQNPEEVRQALNREVQIDPLLLDRVLRTPVGDAAIDRISTSVHTGSRSADREAMRSALVLSVSDDGQTSLIEVIETYPTQRVYVDGQQLVRSYQEIAALSSRLNEIGQQLDNFLEQIPLFQR